MHKILQRAYNSEEERQADCYGFDRGFLFGLLIGAFMLAMVPVVISIIHAISA